MVAPQESYYFLWNCVSKFYFIANLQSQRDFFCRSCNFQAYPKGRNHASEGHVVAIASSYKYSLKLRLHVFGQIFVYFIHFNYTLNLYHIYKPGEALKLLSGNKIKTSFSCRFSCPMPTNELRS